jgi:sphingomyelin phosphodiesterase
MNMHISTFFITFLLTVVIMQVHSRSLMDTTTDVNVLLQIRKLYMKMTTMTTINMECTSCEVGIDSLRLLMRKSKAKSDIIRQLISEVCSLLHLQPTDVCQGLGAQFQDEVYEVLSHAALSSREICGILIDDHCLPNNDPKFSWNITLPDIPKPPFVPPAPPHKSAPKIRVLQFSDIHIDFRYKPGSNANCNKPLCCQGGNELNHGKFLAAGKWGSYGKCDVPSWMVENLFESLSKQGPFDYILWTGDQISHLDWDMSRDDQLRTLDYITRLFLKYFPRVPVLPSLGNHEGIPVNGFPPPIITGNDSSSWLYESLVTNWTHWLSKDTADTLLRGGFYTMILKPGFRVVSLNMNYCNSGNWWLMFNMTDPASQLQWLIDILQYAETNGEKVQIIGHIPPGRPECLKAWSWNYYRIINRYEGVVAAQIFGHTHTDSWQIFYDAESSSFTRALSVAYLAPSVTTYTDLNPGYRVYEMDGFYQNSSWAILDHETFILNLTQANLLDRPVWVKEYSAKEAYNMTALNPTNWDEVYRRMLTDDKLFDTYHKLYFKSSNIATQSKCDQTCRRQMLCDIRSARSHDPDLCAKLLLGDSGLTATDDLQQQYHKYLDWSRQKSLC